MGAILNGMVDSMKKLLFLIPSLGGGGAERVLANLVNNLDREKYDITVQTLFDIGINRQHLQEHITYIPGFPWQVPGNTKLLKLRSPKALYQQLIKKQYDVVISYLEGPTARIVAGCPYPDTKLICWIHVEQHTKEIASYSFRSFEEAHECYACYHEIVCVAESVKKDFESIFDLPKPARVLYNTNETDQILERGAEQVTDLVLSDEVNIFSVGRLRHEKGYDRLIQAHRILLDRGLKHHIYILGEGNEKEKFLQLIAENKVEDTFHLLGFRENPYKYVAKADLFVCSSRREGFSTAVTEALILGVPVVSTLCSGARELLGENDEYGIVTENSEEGVTWGLQRMLTEPGMLEHYREKARERGPFFSKEASVRAVEKMLDSL